MSSQQQFFCLICLICVLTDPKCDPCPICAHRFYDFYCSRLVGGAPNVLATLLRTCHAVYLFSLSIISSIVDSFPFFLIDFSPSLFPVWFSHQTTISTHSSMDLIGAMSAIRVVITRRFHRHLSLPKERFHFYSLASLYLSCIFILITETITAFHLQLK